MRLIAVSVAAALVLACTVIPDGPAPSSPFLPDSIQVVTVSGGQHPSIPNRDTVSVGDTLTIYAVPYRQGSLYVAQVNWFVSDTSKITVISIATYNTMQLTLKASGNAAVLPILGTVAGVDSIHVK